MLPVSRIAYLFPPIVCNLYSVQSIRMSLHCKKNSFKFGLGITFYYLSSVKMFRSFSSFNLLCGGFVRSLFRLWFLVYLVW
ncbi:hypothetical protein EB796_003751 [Bugula neritina]|uniref:Uncharacterized protein n=1 Tax=Bugula neritina TaxID=10212 RepID=A0A7J7KH99_BUGNE|nr:hypothetical protein EB796_003751 [Bugula neritina]